jgi:hypothetical protein
MRACTQYPYEQGVSILESIVVVLITAILLTIGMGIDYRPLQNPLITDTSNITSFFKHARGKAVSTTSAVMILPEGFGGIKAVRGISCEQIDIEDSPDFRISLHPEVSLGDIEWSTCFTSRGLATENVEISLVHQGKTKSIEIMLGGGSRIL